jgi:peroxiredoxin
LNRTFKALNQAEIAIAQSQFTDFLEPTTSYLSVIELGLYDSTVKLYAGLAERHIEPYSPEWNQEIETQLARQRQAMAQRLWPAIPDRKYICFYPMDRRRGESVNWYQVPMPERQRLMHEHGMVGRRYADEVKQIITGSIGFDDWEWGVDLFADDPLVFKKLIYEMRFDEVSAVYALFGAFYVGLKTGASGLPALLKT